MSSSKIAVYSIADLKNTTDDALPNYLNSLQFKQSHYLSDVRLALGYSAVVIAGATFAADFKFGWDATKVVTFWAVVMYFLLNGALTLWIWQVEKGVVYEGEKDGAQISIATSVEKYTPIYNIKVHQHQRQAGGTGSAQNTEYSAPFRTWFNADGQFIAKPFQQWLASVIPLVREADPKSAKIDSSASASASISDTPKKSNGTMATSGDAITPTPKKRGRPKKD